MTDTDLRDLFHDAAPSLDGPDPAAIDRAWRDGTRRRVGTRTAVIASVAASAAAVTGVALLDGPAGRVAPAPSVDSPTSTPTSTPNPNAHPAERAGTYEGAEVWSAPSPIEESKLLLGPAPVPFVIDLFAASVDEIGEPVVALFSGRGQRAFALTESDRVVEIDTSRLEPLTDEAGNGRNPLSYYSLSFDGTSAFFIQNSSLEVLDFVTGEWTSIDTPDWLAEEARWLMADKIWVPTALGEDSGGTVHSLTGGASMTSNVDWLHAWTGPNDEPWGPVAAGRNGTAQAAFTRMALPNRTTNPQALMITRDQKRYVLSLDDLGANDGGTRMKGCCLALGWFDEDTVLFSSSSTEGQRVLAWDVGTDRVYLVSDILGPAGITALADLS
ncbi:MAG: hypothetical protein ABIR39_10375 [Nocardioides sp.]|uniref:hypothetical protein n=1 Tax=Nocardioides sp. TaxID=35761 RepID=UPI0032675326